MGWPRLWAVAAVVCLWLWPIGSESSQQIPREMSLAVERSLEMQVELRDTAIDHTSACIPRRAPHVELDGESIGTSDREEPLGVVLVADQISELGVANAVGCLGGQVAYYVFSEHADYKRISRKYTDIADCLQHVQATGVRSISDFMPRAGLREEYINFIAHRYFALHPNMVFIDTATDGQFLEVAIQEALLGVWNYKPINPSLEPIDLSPCRASRDCDAEQFDAELRALYIRYTCEREGEGEADALSYQERSSLPTMHRSFITSAERIREVWRPEYVWFGQWVQSWAEVSRGDMFSGLAHHFWNVLLGCPELVHLRDNGHVGCARSMRHKNGKRTGEGSVPDPKVFEKKVDLPDPHTLVLNRERYMNLGWLRDDHGKRATFVVTYGGEPDRELEFRPLMRAVAASAMLYHPYADVVVLAPEGLAKGLQKQLELPWFKQRIQVVGLQVDEGIPWHGLSEAEELLRLTPERLAAPWAHRHWLQLVMGWLSTLMASGYGAGEGQQGHVVVMPANTLVSGDVWGAFEGEPFALGFPHDPSEDRFPPGLMYIHRERIWQAEQVLRQLDKQLWNRSSASVEDFVKRHLLGCSEGRLALRAFSGEALVRCPQEDRRMRGAVKLLDAETWSDGRMLAWRSSRVESSRPTRKAHLRTVSSAKRAWEYFQEAAKEMERGQQDEL